MWICVISGGNPRGFCAVVLVCEIGNERGKSVCVGGGGEGKSEYQHYLFPISVQCLPFNPAWRPYVLAVAMTKFPLRSYAATLHSLQISLLLQ